MVNTYKQDEQMTKFNLKNLKRMLNFLIPYKKQFIHAFFAGIFSSISLLFLPKVMAYAIDVAFVKKDFALIILLTILALGLVMISLLFSKIKRDKLLYVLDYVANDMKVAIFKKLQYLPTDYYDTKSHGKIYTRAATYPDEAAAIICYVLLDVILDIISLLFVIIFMLTTNIRLSLISIFLSIILIIVFIALTPIRRKLKQIVNNKISNVNAYVSESINGIRITQSFNREEKNEEILKTLESERINASKRIQLVGNLDWALTGVFNGLSMVLIYFIGLNYLYPSVTIGTIMAVDSYSSRFWGPISFITNSYNEVMEALTYLERIFELLDEPLIIEEKEKTVPLQIKGAIEFKKVSFQYNEQKQILNNLSFVIKNGEKIGLVGETGSGKSTILSLITRFYDINSGEILIDGEDIRNLDLHNLRSNISMMPQDNFLFARTIYENIVLDKKVSRQKVIDVCKQLDIDDSINKLEYGYDTLLLNNGSNLSSGQRQLICLARVMIQDPKILILDEATSNIDLKTERKIIKALDLVSKDRTTIMVAHRLSTIKNCDRIFLIKDKKVAESASHEELMKKKGEYYKLYSHQLLS